MFSNNASSIDIVKLQIQQLSESKAAHNTEVIQRALEITEPEYGSFKLEVLKLTMSGGRMRRSSLEGELINTIFLPANELWDTNHLAIKIPVRLGLLSYRLLLVNKADIAKFEKITSLADLKKLTAGVATSWQTTKIFKNQGLKLVETGHFDGIFSMLNKHRFDYLPRGIYEIYAELDARQDLLDDVVVEPTLALNIPMFTYVYVSPKYPRLAKRLQTGLAKLLVNGELKEILYKHYANDIKRANLKARKIITIDNDNYNHRDSKYDEYLLFTP